ncbi:putative late blight resistance protein homolog R1B-8 [Cornus florida]|uniref:putative late blight resistance protein homolog R1B-8 n=1 Tax=Cornus florida TaxID=4283 RepID=UPI0028988F12|nr:putative late blight resistance protein homolog R1B-8 [Cornus florida]
MGRSELFGHFVLFFLIGYECLLGWSITTSTHQLSILINFFLMILICLRWYFVMEETKLIKVLIRKCVGFLEYLSSFSFLAFMIYYIITHESTTPIINMLMLKWLDFLVRLLVFLVCLSCGYYLPYGFPYRINVLLGKCCDLLFLNFSGVLEEITLIRTQVMEIYEKKMYGIGIIEVQKIGRPSNGASSRPISPTLQEETIVGFNDEATTIMELLTQEYEKQLKLVSIVGMPGLGKTTLARKVYNHPLIQYYFPIRAWTYVSQVYRKRDLLLAIFRSAFQFRYEICHISDEKLGEDLSRIICTSRHEGVALALHAKFHRLRFLDENESWDLLRLKTFREGSCPPELMETGKQIARKCHGLPLAIIVISGLLAKNDKTLEWWKHVAGSVSSYIVRDPEKYMDTLALSYNHLPLHLRPCFLYFGAFPEDYEIPVRKLIWLWIAEGFIWKNDEKRLEEVAEDYLMDLIDRSLVTVSKTRFNGAAKACRVHDLLHDLCLRKENLSYANASRVRSILSFGPSDWWNNLCLMNAPFIYQEFILLKVLNLSSFQIPSFPWEISQEYLMMASALFWMAYKPWASCNLYSGDEESLKWIPNLNKLKCYIRKGLNGDDYFPKLDFLIHLETLNVISNEAFEGQRWDTNGEFCKLRFLKFQGLDIRQWYASSNHFPSLQRLVLEGCAWLEEIPFGLGDISTLEEIQLRNCSFSLENSAKKIQEEQRSMGNDELKIQILARKMEY